MIAVPECHVSNVDSLTRDCTDGGSKLSQLAGTRSIYETKKVIFLLGVIMILTTSGGCGLIAETSEIPVSPIQQLFPTLSTDNIAPALTSTYISTRMPSFASSYTPMPSSTPTATPASPTYIPPTLPVEEARLSLLDLFANNGNCRLPCLWGITPGISTYIEAQQVLVPLSSISDLVEFWPELGAIHPNYYENDLLINTVVDLFTFTDNKIVSHIYFSVEAFNKKKSDLSISDPGFVFNSDLFGNKLAFYMLPRILSEYGKPFSVLLRTAPGPNERGEMGLFNIVLMYPNQGFLIQYTNKSRMSGSNVVLCPANSHITVDLYPSGHGDTFSELIAQGWNDVLVPYKPLEDVTSMSLDQFYQNLQKPTDQCILTASANWPEPNQ